MYVARMQATRLFISFRILLAMAISTKICPRTGSVNVAANIFLPRVPFNGLKNGR